MRLAALSAAALLCAAPSRPEDASGARGPGAARALGGMAGFEALSEVTLAAAPDDAHTLEVVMVFPDRARWTLRRVATDDRRIQYRFGEHAFALDVAERRSTSLTPEELGPFLRRQALRQAAFLWPEGAAWETVGAGCEARVGALAGDPAEAAIGRLAAELDAGGRPRSIGVKDAAGRLEETLEILAWKSAGGREWPSRLRLSAGGETIWEEVVDEVSGVQYSDRSFVPLDRRAVLRPYASVDRARLPDAAVVRVALTTAAGWEAALERAVSARLELEPGLARAGLALDERAWIALDPDTLAPAGLELCLTTLPSTLPPGFERRPAQDALELVLGGEAPPGAAERDRLRAALPTGRKALSWTAAVGQGEVRFACVLAP